MSSVRDLLEQAALPTSGLPGTASQLRRRGDRRRRTSRVAGTALALTSLVLAVGAAGALLRTPAPPAAGPVSSASATPTPSMTGYPLQSMEGTRWIVDLVAAGVTTEQAYPDEKANAPRALLTFERGGLLLLDVMLPGRGTTTLQGAWTATAPEPSAGLDASLTTSLTLALVPGSGVPPEVAALVAKLSLVTYAEGYLPESPPPSLEPMTLMLYTSSRTTLAGVIDLVRPSVVLPPPYPARP